MHIEKELVESKIRILRDKGAKNNSQILKILSLKGPLIKYDLFKELKSSKTKMSEKNVGYPTVSRRVDALVNKGYLQVVGKRVIIVGKREGESSKYGISWKGFLAGLTIDSVAEDVLNVLELNSQLELPFPKEEPIRVTRAIFSNKEMQSIAQALLTGYLKAIPKDLESLKPEQVPMYLFPALTEAPQPTQSFEKKDMSKLLQIPEVFDFISGSLNKTENMLENSLTAIRDLKKGLTTASKANIQPVTGIEIE